MSAEAKEDVEMTVDAQEVEDEYVVSFEDLDSSADVKDKTSEFQKLLQNSRYDEKAVKVKEQCIYRLAKLYTEGKQFAEVMALLKSNNELFSLIPKAKTAKIVRNILNIVGSIPDSLEIQISLSRDVVQWCIAEKRTFLRQRIEAKVNFL